MWWQELASGEQAARRREADMQAEHDQRVDQASVTLLCVNVRRGADRCMPWRCSYLSTRSLRCVGAAVCGGEYLVQADTSRTQLQQQVLIKQLQQEVGNAATHRQDLEQQLRVTPSGHSYNILSCCVGSGHSYTAADTSGSIGNGALVAQVPNKTADVQLQTTAGCDVCVLVAVRSGTRLCSRHKRCVNGRATVARHVSMFRGPKFVSFLIKTIIVDLKHAHVWRRC